VTGELSTSGEKGIKSEEEDGAEDEDKVGEDDAETTIGKAAEAPRTKPGTPPGYRSRMGQSASIWLSE